MMQELLTCIDHSCIDDNDDDDDDRKDKAKEKESSWQVKRERKEVPFYSTTPRILQ